LVLVGGASGFVGSHFVGELLQVGGISSIIFYDVPITTLNETFVLESATFE
jgi:uncharacterized protein YbjT (DUF2867 family)